MKRLRSSRTVRSAPLVVIVLAASLFVYGGAALAAPSPVGLGAATDAAVVAAESPTNAGVSTITGDVSSINQSQPGFAPCPGVPVAPCVVYLSGGQHKNDVTATDDKAAALAAWVNTSTLGGATAILPGLGGTTQVAGLYSVGATNITGTLTLDAANDPSSVWIFQATHIQTATNSNVVFVNTAGTTPAQLACNVFWTTDSANLLGTTFVGTIMANTSITVGAGVTVDGRLFANNGNVTLISDVIRAPSCTTLPPGTGGGPTTPLPPGTGGGPTTPLPPGTGGGPTTPGEGTPSTPATPVGAPPSFTG